MKKLLPVLILLGFANGWAQLPDPRDSVIIESKTVSPLSGACGSAGVTLRIWITNKDSLSAVVLPLETKSAGGGAYAILSRPGGCGARTFGSVAGVLIPSGQLQTRTLSASNYHSNPPDTFLLGLVTSDLSDLLEPNATRRALLDIKFDSVSSSLGLFEIDSSVVLANRLAFFDALGNRVPVSFVKSSVVVTVPGTPCLSLQCFSASQNLLYGRSHTFDFCEDGPGTWSVTGGPGSINAASGVYTFNGQCALGAVPVTVRFSPQSGGFAECPFTLTIVDNSPSAGAAADTVVVSHGQTASNQINASDPDAGDAFAYATLSGPGAANGSGLWSYSTGCADVGSSPQTVRVKVSDAFQGCQPGPKADTTQFVLIVTNSTPAYTNCPTGSVFADTGTLFTFQLSAADADPADAGALAFSLVSGPSGLSVSPSGQIQWTPAPAQVGPHTVVFRAADLCGVFADCLINFEAGKRKGDLDGDGVLSSVDVVQLLGCVFLGTPPSGGIEDCDLDCDGEPTASDVVALLNAVFLGAQLPC